MNEEAHGESTVTLFEDNIIDVKLIGSFNELGAEHYIAKLQGLIETFNNQDFAILVDTRKLEGGTPETYQKFELYNQWLVSQALIAKAVVIPNDATISIVKSLSPSLNNQNVQYFKDNPSAIG